MKLYYFTNSYPYGLGLQWKENELNVLKDHFESITVVPLSYAGNTSRPKTLPAGVQLEGPLFENENLQASKKDLWKILAHKKRGAFLKEFFAKKIYTSKKRYVTWFSHTLNIIRILDHPVIRKIVSSADTNTVFYFYWGKGICEILPFIDCKRLNKTFIRMHRYDLFEYVNNNYIPYRDALLNCTTLVAPSSEAGKAHLQELYPQAAARIDVFRCGTIGINKLSRASEDRVLRIVSCSLLSPVKRVHLMIECIQYLQMPVIWHHVGDGQLRNELKELAVQKGVQDKFIFEGMMDSRKVLEYYAANTFDLFINVSASEGVPFSIMEAFSAGIPVMATAVGGSGEIVDDEVGALLPADLTAQQLAKQITDYYNLPPERKQTIRKEAYNRYLNKWNAEKLAVELAACLKS